MSRVAIIMSIYNFHTYLLLKLNNIPIMSSRFLSELKSDYNFKSIEIFAIYQLCVYFRWRNNLPSLQFSSNQYNR